MFQILSINLNDVLDNVAVFSLNVGDDADGHQYGGLKMARWFAKAVKKNSLLKGTDQWGRSIKDLIFGEVLTVSGSLQQLANTAVGGPNAAPTVDFRQAIVDGYLTSA
ncbi:hypothetical protein MMC13_006477 [Lambiella insularis]|nr:hypothetical protein [Lambiella insularis]